MEYSDIKKIFSENHIVRVTFTKKDGSIRIMECTTNLYLVPLSKHPKNKEEVGTKEENVPVIYNVYDLERFAWRSFIIANVISIEVI